MNHIVQRMGATSSNGAAPRPCFSPYFGQNGYGTDRITAVQVELQFERPLYLRADRRLMADCCHLGKRLFST